MPTYAVTVGNKEYEVDAPDPNKAWQWANVHHAGKTAGSPGALTKESAMRTAVGDPEAPDPAYARHAAMFGVNVGDANAADGSTAAPDQSGAPPARPPAPAPAGVGLDAATGKPKFPVNLNPSLTEGVNATSNFADRAIAGIGSVATSPFVAARQAMGKATPQELEEEKTKTETPAGAVGNIVGNLLALGIPIAKATELATNIGAKFLPKAVSSAIAVPAIAGLEGATAPVQPGESRGGNMLKSTLMASGLQAGGNLFRRALTQPVVPSDEAKKLMDLGIQPTVRQGGTGAAGTVVGAAQDVTQALPFIGKNIRAGGNRVEQEILDTAGQRAHPNPLPSAETVKRGDYVTNMFDDLDTAYRAVLAGKTVPVSGLLRSQSRTTALAEMTSLTAPEQRAVLNDVEAILPKHSGTMSAETWHDVQTKIRQRMRQHAGVENSFVDQQKANAYSAVEAQLGKIRDRAFSKDDVARLAEIDKAFGHAVVIDKSLQYPSGKAGDNLVRAVEAVTPDKLKTRNLGWMQDLTEPSKPILASESARDSLTQRVGYGAAGATLGVTSGLLSGPALALLPAVAALGKVASTRTGAKALMGGYGWQQSLADNLRKINPGMAATIGGTTEER